jgi:hypothetical protein
MLFKVIEKDNVMPQRRPVIGFLGGGRMVSG